MFITEDGVVLETIFQQGWRGQRVAGNGVEMVCGMFNQKFSFSGCKWRELIDELGNEGEVFK